MAKDRLSGKLAVILHADIAGSTQMVQQDEHLAHDRIQETFRQFSETIKEYSGLVLELRGDALLAEFERPSDAVSASLAFQSRHSKFLSSIGDELKPEVRVGISMGEVVVADNTITGEGVVLAQRLEQIAEPGGLCITPAIREALPSRLPFDLANLGERDLKGFDETIEVYRVALRRGAVMPMPESGSRRKSRGEKPRLKIAGTVLLLIIFALGVYAFVIARQEFTPKTSEPVEQSTVDKPSIAVLPFDNLSGDPEQEYFADGITEDLTTDLSKISGLFVVARNSAFYYKGRQVDVRTVGEELGVRYVLEGSIRRAANQVRINAQLIDAVSGGHIWADRFDGTLADVFALQDQVNRKIVAALEVNLTETDEARFDQVETSVPEAYDKLLRGVELFNVYNREAVAESRELFRQAAELDPNYARAWANIAFTHATEVSFHWSDDREKSIRVGLEFSNRALALDDSIPQIYLTRSILYLSQRQHQAGLEAAKRTIEVHPNYADGYVTLAFISSYSGEYEQALDALTRARKINPQGTGVYLGIHGRVLFLTKRHEEALPIAEESIERNPGFDRTQLTLAAIQAELGLLDDAAWSVEEALAINPDLSLTQLRRNSLYQDDADIEHFLSALRKAGLPE